MSTSCYRADDGNAFRHFETFTQELRLQGSAFSGLLDWLVGGYFASEDLHVRDNLTFGTQYGAFAACRLVATVSPNPALRNPAAPGCLSPTAHGADADRRRFGAAGAGHPRRPRPPQHGQQCRRQRLQLFPGQQQLGDLHPQYLQHHRHLAPDPRPALHPREQGFLGHLQQHQHDLPDPAGLLLALPDRRRDAAAGDAAARSPGGIVNLTCQGNSSSSLNALNLSDDRSESEWTGTGVLSWKPTTRLLLYASFSRGYKAGGFNLDRSALGQPIFAPTDPRQFGGRNAGFNTGNLQFDPEMVDAYEVGFKWTQRSFILNVAAFRQPFSNFQLNTFNGSVFLVQNINGCSASLGTTDAGPSGAAPTGACAGGRCHARA